MHRKQITQEITCIKHVFKPIYKYKKNCVYGQKGPAVQWCLEWRHGGGKYLQYLLGFFFCCFLLFYKITRYIIPYSFSQQNEFYKLIVQKWGEKKKSQFHKKNLFPIPLPKLYSISTFVEYLQVLKYIHPLLSIESHLVQVTREQKKIIWTYQDNASDTPQSEHSSGCSGMKGDFFFYFIFIHKYLQGCFFPFNIGIYFNNK